MSTLLIEPFGGLAGDMLLGALIDLGADPERLRRGLASLGLPAWSLDVEPAVRRSIGCTRASFRVSTEAHHRYLPEIQARIQASTLPERAKARALAAFGALAEAEAKVHRTALDQVHFHEVGAADAILDLCGNALALEELGISTLLTTPLPGGRGEVPTAHGRLPCPVPAVVELIQVPFLLLSEVGEGEMVTPTGAAMIRAWARPVPPGTPLGLVRVAYGAGTRRTSLTRVSRLAEAPAEREWIVELSFQVDDLPGTHLGWLLERALEEGALDVTLAPVTMKRSRPGHLVSLWCSPEREEALVRLAFSETTTLGMRRQLIERWVLPRRIAEVPTPYGPIRVKWVGDDPRPEIQDCAAAARQSGHTLAQVLQVVKDCAGD